MKIFISKYTLALIALVNHAQLLRADCYAHTIFVPRQMAYNPIYENALVFNEYAHMDEQFLFSVKPIYTQTVGSSIKKYFNINHACSMNVQENGSGNIDPLWFQVISAPGTFYSSTLSFHPIQKTYGALLYLAWMLPADFAITINTAAIQRKNNIHICEQGIISGDIGQAPGFATVTQAFANADLNYGRICGTVSKGGVDDLQIKLLKNFWSCGESFFADIYALVGVPTGRGSQARYLFEPLVGSRHTQVGLGCNAEKSFGFCGCDYFSFYGEFKWRYGCRARELRSFDLTPNGQWSRYLLFTTPTAVATPFPAINVLTFKTDVTPRNAVDLLLAVHVEHRNAIFEVGYNFWYRQAEKVDPCISLPAVGIADLVGIAQLANAMPVTVTSSSAATISEGVYPNEFQMPRDPTYTLETAKNINVCSGAQAASCTNGVFGSIGYHGDCFDFGVNVSYEGAANKNSASIVSVWVNVDARF